MTARKAKQKAPRKTEVEKEADRFAAMLAPFDGDGDALAPPKFITDPRMKAAAAVWDELAPVQAKLLRFEAQHRQMFACFCYYYSEWLQAVDDIAEQGFSVMVATVSGDKMPRKNPSVARRDVAFKQMMDLSGRFGFTPMDQWSLARAQASDDAQAELGLSRPQQPRDKGKGADAPAEPDPHAAEWHDAISGSAAVN